MVSGPSLSQWRGGGRRGAFRSVRSRSWTASRGRAVERRTESEQRQRPSSGGGGGGETLIITNILHAHVWTAGPHDSSHVDNSYFRKAFTFKMPILLFLLDTSASMNQRTYLGTTYLDVAKGAVEVFMKVKNDFTPTFSHQVCTFWRAYGSFGQDWSKLIYVVFWFSLFFWQLRARDPASRGDRYMLVTFDDPPYGVKVISNWCLFYMSQVERIFLSVRLYCPSGL